MLNKTTKHNMINIATIKKQISKTRFCFSLVSNFY